MKALDPLRINSYQPATGLRPVDCHRSTSRNSQSLVLTDEMSPGLGQAQKLNVEFWLPFAAKELGISPQLRDYVIVPTVGFWTEVPNVNGDCVTKAELMKWRPQDGCCAYGTWRGKGTYWNHESNTDPYSSSGIIFDSYVQAMPGFRGNHLKLMLLLGFDRGRNPELARQILNRQVTSYSVGMSYSSYVNSITGVEHDPDPSKNYDTLTRLGTATYQNDEGKLVFRYLRNIRGFECSAVDVPAYNSAIGDTVIDASSGRTHHY